MSKYIDVMEALDILPEDLTQEQMSRLKVLAEEVKDPTNMRVVEADRIIEELGIDIEKIQSKNTRKEKGKKIGRNERCPCGSGKKWKKCCITTGRVQC